MEKSNNIKKYLLGGLIIITIIFLIIYCRKNPIKPTLETKPVSIVIDSVKNIPFFVVKTPLIAQKGPTSCWAASLQMLFPSDSSFFKNSENTVRVHSDSLQKLMSGLKRQSFANIGEPSWDKIKQQLISENSLLSYKYYDNRFAHVFVIRGYQEANNSRWLLINDPYPQNKAKLAAVAYNHFLKPHTGQNNYTDIDYCLSSSCPKSFTEPSLSIFSKESLKSNKPDIYEPPYKQVSKKDKLSNRETEIIIKEQFKLFKKMDVITFKTLNINYIPLKDTLLLDLKTNSRVTWFHNTATFLNYKINASLDNYFDASKLEFVNILNKKKVAMTITLQQENNSTKPYYYVSRFENYANSAKANWDLVRDDLKIAIKKPSIWALLRGKRGLSNDKTMPRPNSNSSITEDPEEIDDVAIMSLPGGPIYSFKYAEFPEKIVADPYRQLKVKPGAKALFISPSGTAFYRLSAIELPREYDTVLKNTALLQEQNTNIQNFNISTGISSSTLPLTLQSPDQQWRNLTNGNIASFAVAAFETYWTPTPLAKTNAQWISSTQSNNTQVPGIYTFIRKFTIDKDASKLVYDLQIAYDDELVSFEIIDPSGQVTNLKPKVIRSTNPTIYFPSSSIKGEIMNPKKGEWKIRVKTNFIDEVAAFLVSGFVSTRW